MPLTIDLKPHEKLFINGAVLANGESRASFQVLNDAALLRERDILTEEKADTPCKRVYFAVQSLYMDPAHTTDYLPVFVRLSRDVRQAAASADPILAEIEDCVAEGRLYPALKAARRLIEYEEELLNHARQSP